MEFDPTWLLLGLPLAFGLGWLASRLDLRQMREENRRAPKAYFKGLNYLLNEQQDQAIDAFIEAVQNDPDTTELHFALGNLFRRRGETERAIRMHQNLIERVDLSPELKLQALSELGQDFLKAGLLDRAEEVFSRLRGTSRDEEAKRNLLEIYQQEKDWQKAIAIAKEMPDYATQKEIANYYCELAAGEMINSRPDSARQYLDSALSLHRNCVRASVLQGDLLQQGGDLAAAIEAWKRIESQNPAYLAIVARKLQDAYLAQGQREEGLQLLRGYLASYPSLDLLETVFQLVMDAEGPEAAYRLVRDELRRNPTLLGLDRLLEAQLLGVPPEKRADLELVRNLVHNHTRRLARYRCDNCGFKARHFYWRCPACGGWETYPPRRTEEFDLIP